MCMQHLFTLRLLAGSVGECLETRYSSKYHMIVCGIWPSICSSAFGREWRKAVVVAAISTDTHISVKVSLGARNTLFSFSYRISPIPALVTNHSSAFGRECDWPYPIIYIGGWFSRWSSDLGSFLGRQAFGWDPGIEH